MGAVAFTRKGAPTTCPAVIQTSQNTENNLKGSGGTAPSTIFKLKTCREKEN